MKSSVQKLAIATVSAMLALQFPLAAQTNVTVAASTSAATEVHQNTAIIPVPRTGSITNRQALVLRRAKEAPGDYDIEFIGDSIMQGWEGRRQERVAGILRHRKVINFGVSGDRTQHVLWRFEQGQLDGIKAKVAVVMIGTNNSGHGRQHSRRNSGRGHGGRKPDPRPSAGHQNPPARHFPARPDFQ